LALALLGGQFTEGDTVQVEYRDGCFVFEKAREAEAVTA
jgi:hypothetical protein